MLVPTPRMRAITTPPETFRCESPRRLRCLRHDLVVKKNPADLERMLTYSKGARRVPVIVDGGKVTIGFGGT